MGERIIIGKIPLDIFEVSETEVELLPWKSATERADAIEQRERVGLVRASTGQRYLGTFSTSSVSASGAASRHMWNYTPIKPTNGVR